jgi:hypothetical protein
MALTKQKTGLPHLQNHKQSSGCSTKSPPPPPACPPMPCGPDIKGESLTFKNSMVHSATKWLGHQASEHPPAHTHRHRHRHNLHKHVETDMQ